MVSRKKKEDLKTKILIILNNIINIILIIILYLINVMVYFQPGE